MSAAASPRPSATPPAASTSVSGAPGGTVEYTGVKSIVVNTGNNDTSINIANGVTVPVTITSGTGELIFNNYSTSNGGSARELLVASQVTGNINVTIAGAGNNGVFTQTNAGGQVELQSSANNFTGTITILGGRLGNGAPSQAALGLGTATNPVVIVGNATGGGQWFMNGAQTVSRPVTLSGVGWAEKPWVPPIRVAGIRQKRV